MMGFGSALIVGPCVTPPLARGAGLCRSDRKRLAWRVGAVRVRHRDGFAVAGVRHVRRKYPAPVRSVAGTCEARIRLRFSRRGDLGDIARYSDLDWRYCFVGRGPRSVPGVYLAGAAASRAKPGTSMAQVACRGGDNISWLSVALLMISAVAGSFGLLGQLTGITGIRDIHRCACGQIRNRHHIASAR